MFLTPIFQGLNLRQTLFITLFRESLDIFNDLPKDVEVIDDPRKVIRTVHRMFAELI